MSSRPDQMPATSAGGHFARRRTALAFVKKVLRANGRISPEEAATMREAGFSDREIVRIVSQVIPARRTG